MCGAFERKEKWFLGIEKNNIYHDIATKNVEVHHWSLKIKINIIYF